MYIVKLQFRCVIYGILNVVASVSPLSLYLFGSLNLVLVIGDSLVTTLILPNSFFIFVVGDWQTRYVS